MYVFNPIYGSTLYMCVSAHSLYHIYGPTLCTVQTWVQSAAPKKHFSFTLPHQPRTLEISILHQPRTGTFAWQAPKYAKNPRFSIPHPQNKIDIFRARSHPAGQKTIFLRGDIKSVRYSSILDHKESLPEKWHGAFWLVHIQVTFWVVHTQVTF